MDTIITETAEAVALAAVGDMLYELHQYNLESDCVPDWHIGFCDAMNKIAELQKTIRAGLTLPDRPINSEREQYDTVPHSRSKKILP